MTKNLIISLGIAGSIRYLLMISSFSKNIQNRVEIATPLNSWKRVKEGCFLYNNGINPYTGDNYHENPLILVATNFLINSFEYLIPLIFILLDLLGSLMLHQAATKFVQEMFDKQKKVISKYAEGTEEIHIKIEDKTNIPFYVAVAFLFNPYSVLNCVGQTSTVWSNFLLAAFFYFLSKKQNIPTVLALALETQKNLYPFVLIVPAALYFSKEENKLNKFQFVRTIFMFILALAGVNYLGHGIVGNWSFLDATYGFILNHRDLQPNIGLFWYFFTEMFDHFRTLFLYTFQMNATILYLIPLTLKLKDEPIMLATVLIALSAIFRSYPCVGDVAFYMALLPLWKNCSKFMAHNFIVGCFFLVTSVLGPTVYYLWIYARSANANFYFGVTLAFAAAQIFLVTDLLFAHIKREFCLIEGLEFKIDGKEAKMALE